MLVYKYIEMRKKVIIVVPPNCNCMQSNVIAELDCCSMLE